MGLRKEVPHAKCSPLCAIKEKLQALWDRTYGCINKINDITPDGDGKFTIQGGQNVSITPISNGIAFDTVFPSGVLTINGQTPDADGDISGIATTAQLSDGSVTKVGTANVGTDTKPIKLVAGVPTAITNDLVDVSSAQTISGAKTFGTNPTVKNGLSATDGYVTLPTRAYNSANINDAVTIGSLAANPNVVHTTGNENIAGTKRFINPIQETVGLSTGTPAATQISNIITFYANDETRMGNFYLLKDTSAKTYLFIELRNSDGTYSYTQLAVST